MTFTQSQLSYLPTDLIKTHFWNKYNFSVKLIIMESCYIAGVELGGTTCLAAIAELSQPTTIVESFEAKTTFPQETLPQLAKFLKAKLASLNIASFRAIGIASFGPVDLHEDSETYGYITSTPKEAWRNAEVLGFFKREFGDSTAIAFETDVNAPAMAEMAQRQCAHPPGPSSLAYITVGTGVGVGAVVDGAPIHGLLHPEGGHMMIPPIPGDTYKGGCAFNHGYCVEGMVHSKAIAERAGVEKTELHTLSDDHDVWEKVGYYLGVLCLNITYLISPHVIVLGGGVMKRKILYSKARRWFKELNKGYLNIEKFKTEQGLESYICESVFGNSAGITGALEIARKKAYGN